MGVERCNEFGLLSDLLMLSHGTLKVSKGAHLFHEGEESKEFFVVKKGLIQLSKLSEEGREVAVSLSQEGSILGEMTLFNYENKHIFNARALQDSEVYKIFNHQLEQAIEKDVTLSMRLIKFMSIAVRKQQTKFRDLMLNGKKGAVYSTLIRLSNSYGKQVENGILIDIPLTNQEIANYSVTTREGVNRILQELQSKNILSIGRGRKMVIHDVNYLKKAINCENCPIEYCNLE